MSTEISELIDEAAPAVTGVVRGTRDEQLGAATPCAEFRVRDLLNHLSQVAVNFQRLARREQVDWAPGPDRLTGDWREAFAADVRQVRDDWSDPAVLDGVSPGMGLPHRVLGLMLVADLVVHGWDLARATGQEYAVPARLLGATAEFLGIMAETGRTMGAFGPEVVAPDDAGELERLLAVTGRDPRWQPA